MKIGLVEAVVEMEKIIGIEEGWLVLLTGIDWSCDGLVVPNVHLGLILNP